MQYRTWCRRQPEIDLNGQKAVRNKGVLDSPFMEAGSPLYATLRQHYLFSGLDQDDFDKLAVSVSAKELAKVAKSCFIAATRQLVSIS